MARTTTVLRVLVSSPGDLDDERSLIPDVFDELNRILERSGIRLEPIMWETSGRPGVGADAQDVLNRQFGDDYDVFLGCLGARFGTPTGRAESGTEEEFERAMRRLEDNPTSLRVLVYFKDASMPLSRIDPEQLAKVQRFKQRIESRGVLNYSFSTRDEFAKMLRVHLAKEVGEWGESWGPSAERSRRSQTREDATSAVARELEEEPGLLDLVEIGSEQLNNLTAATYRMNDLTTALGEKMNQRTAELELAKKVGGGQQKRVINRSAADLEDFASRMEAEVTQMARSVENGLDAIARAVALAVDFGEEGSKQARDLLEPIRALRASIEGARSNVTGMRATISSFPRLTADLNRAKRAAVDVIGWLESEMGKAIRMSGAIEEVILGLGR